MADFKYGDITEKIIGASFKVHSALGNGFQEVIYQRALELEFNIMPLNYAREFEMPIYYLDQQIGTEKHTHNRYKRKLSKKSQHRYNRAFNKKQQEQNILQAVGA